MSSIEELERDLAGPGGPTGRPDLAAIHRLGRRRRRIRTAAVGGAAALSVAAAVGIGVTVGGDPGSGDSLAAADAPPDHLSPLAQRVLSDVPGAVQVNSGQVVIPAPDVDRQFTQRIDVEGRPVRLPRDYYAGVTSWPARAFPAWLYDGTQAAEQAEDDGSGYPVGTSDLTGVLVDAGGRYLGCALPRKAWGADGGESCFPAILTQRPDGGWTYEYGLGTDRFLQPGAPMEVFSEESYVSGDLTTLAVAGIDGTSVASVQLVATDGTVVDGTVEAGTLVPGESMFFGEVPGELARVVAYDAQGDVIEDHRLRDCTGGADCEVR
ncbi:MAG TPA: hypothetical protein VNS55_04955 [Nocardioides sp.]|nr:hypothetical protein [Nocardioides sp.]